MGRIIPYIMENRKCLKPPTRQYFCNHMQKELLKKARLPKTKDMRFVASCGCRCSGDRVKRYDWINLEPKWHGQKHKSFCPFPLTGPRINHPPALRWLYGGGWCRGQKYRCQEHVLGAFPCCYKMQLYMWSRLNIPEIYRWTLTISITIKINLLGEAYIWMHMMCSGAVRAPNVFKCKNKCYDTGGDVKKDWKERNIINLNMLSRNVHQNMGIGFGAIGSTTKDP